MAYKSGNGSAAFGRYFNCKCTRYHRNTSFSHLWDVEINNNVTYDVDVVGKKASGEGDMLRGGTCNYYCLACICLRNGFKPIYNKDYWVLGCNADRYYCGFDVGII